MPNDRPKSRITLFRARALVFVIGSYAIIACATVSPSVSSIPIITLINPSDTPIPTPTITPTPLEGFPTARPTATIAATIAVPTDAPAATPTVEPEYHEFGTVVKIVDGDTIDVLLGDTALRVRYIGINTPETDQACGSDATAANRALVEGQMVRLVKDISQTDRYGRLLRYVYVDELFVNAELVRQGWAEAVSYPPDTRYADLFRDMQDLARAANSGCWPSGVWGDQPPLQPTSTSDGGAVCDCAGNLYNCKDFATHTEAQACYNYCVTVTGGDVHDLDSDGDGQACETLPG